MEGIKTVADFSDMIDIMYGVGDDVYKKHKGNKMVLKQLMCDVLDRIYYLDNTKNGLNFKYRDSAKIKYSEFLKKYNTKDLWESKVKKQL
jgi:hypothetical protein